MKRHNITLNKIKLILSLGIASGSLFLKLVLKRIQIAKLIILNDIENGDPGLLVSDISQDKWPYSFRFYDFILQFVDKRLSNLNKKAHRTEKKISIKVDQRDMSRRFAYNLFRKSEQEDKLTFKH
jgi:hypothetical protein